ncbi:MULTISPECIES: SDR family NAD(P)-dependent oxidoreductase [Cryobacterium]|uniref:SDR family NAD(P)-dependent oxidoreductase n=1 Tax=Cryobacterium glucosi TaxID=1259175 RepID=A0ABY2IR64_9MICO|nr:MULTISPECIES: SDR family NAD(P)-dependent oxidoreductase [Cryobacterium]TFB96034.1 SDR family NAD(P)-dependent oxidoreductase [Cryobacterium sp. MDB2-A-1]TFC07928.1 SDR family NAD(P)-dependent oxidoreductase [Cryobacterium sp. MDB2-33-2]TFC13194.1 SDR family NAD(P)-dependent oxidoreductase [Cryobacterium sp. MDB2-A-2]TFC16329.1 SDR family NAD(P)-dependent oxidoreductase [Cryobacterium sp. MDB2-10]TFC23012.1 SDR family NAD(P)-dependent oxidoreductase [Cryobacterium glucosi]
MRIDGCSALVTGAASGLGLATVTALHAAGAAVVLLDLPGAPGAAIVAALGDRTRFVAGDVTSVGDVHSAVEAAVSMAPLRIVVTCAGIAPAERTVGRDGPLPLDDFERVIRVNLTGTFNVIRLAAAAMLAAEPIDEMAIGLGAGSGAGAGAGGGGTAERGVIVTTASVAAFDGQVGQAAYAASKGGVAAMTLPLAREFARSLIRVVSIAPGVFDTAMLQGMPAAVRESLAAQVPHPARLGDPSEFAALVRHIVENPMLNGETIRLDGGIRMPPR